ncbi:MAG: hypothetical protein PHX87_05685 [Candidatus Peribacteraceae bacterium]|nr:hypothetical protein [Candidatus Peribacteraceae bacterium]MDD5742884.1 hypothetical protein [Candidatus Peribacteraceae bacterium]
MGEMLNEIGSSVGKAVEGPATLPVKIAENAVRTLEGKPFLASTKHDIVDAGWNLLAAPHRILWSVIKGVSKGTLRLTWNAIKLLPLPLPMLDSWKAERTKQGLGTSTSLNNLREQLSLLPQKKFSMPAETQHQQAT